MFFILSFVFLIFPPDAFCQNFNVYDVNQHVFRKMYLAQIFENGNLNNKAKVYNVDKYGYKEINPSLIIEKDRYNQYKTSVYETDKYGYKKLNPSQIIEKDKYNENRSTVYETDQYGYKKLNPSQIIEKDKYNDKKTYIYNTDQYGYKELNPSFVLEDKGNKIEVYRIKNGLKEINPFQIIEK